MARLSDRPQPPLPPASPGSPRRMLPPASPALHQRSWAALTLAALSFLGMVMTGGGNMRRAPVVLAVTLVIAATAVGLAVSAMSQARRAGTARPRGSVFATVLGVLALGFSAFSLIGFAMFWPQITKFSDCMHGAGTVSAQDACQRQLNTSVSKELTILGSR